MGILRFWLALTVALMHVGAPFQPLSGGLAVEAFYIVSGFLIQFVILRYKAGGSAWIKRFYFSRILRIFPTYYLFLFLTALLLFSPWGMSSFDFTLFKNALTAAWFAFTNLFIVGQDASRFLVYTPETLNLYFADYDQVKSTYWASRLALIGQAWSLALELTFYALAPWLLTRSTRLVVIIALASAALKAALWNAGYGMQMNWYNAFFPSELCLFLAGSLACRYYETKLCLQAAHRFGLPLYVLISGFLIILSAYYPNVTSADPHLAGTTGWLLGMAYLLLVALLLPFLFHSGQRVRWDRFIGELSYPIYLGHLLIIDVVTRLDVPAQYHWQVVIVSIIALSIPIALWVERPLTLLRHRLFRKH